MSDLIPNLGDLLAALPSTPAGRDAAELATAADAANSWAEVDVALESVVDRWATP